MVRCCFLDTGTSIIQSVGNLVGIGASCTSSVVIQPYPPLLPYVGRRLSKPLRNTHGLTDRVNASSGSVYIMSFVLEVPSRLVSIGTFVSTRRFPRNIA